LSKIKQFPAELLIIYHVLPPASRYDFTFEPLTLKVYGTSCVT